MGWILLGVGPVLENRIGKLQARFLSGRGDLFIRLLSDLLNKQGAAREISGELGRKEVWDLEKEL